MQGFLDKKKQLKMAASQPFWILFLQKFVMCYPCVRPYILFYKYDPDIFHCFITKLFKFKMVAKRPF